MHGQEMGGIAVVECHYAFEVMLKGCEVNW